MRGSFYVCYPEFLLFILVFVQGEGGGSFGFGVLSIRRFDGAFTGLLSQVGG